MKRIVILGAMALTLSLAVPMTVQAEENGTDKMCIRDRCGQGAESGRRIPAPFYQQPEGARRGSMDKEIYISGRGHPQSQGNHIPDGGT